MQALKILFGFFGRFLFSFSTVGFRVRSLFWSAPKLDASGQTWLVTGASGGLGAALTHAAARAGADVIAVARAADKLEAMRVAVGPVSGRIKPHVADCGNVAAMRSLASTLDTNIDVLVNNVGVMLADYEQTAEGIEASFATNVLAPYAMTNSIAAANRLTDDAIIISVSSGGMYNVPLVPAALESNRDNHIGARTYAFHKRAQLGLTQHWQQQEKHNRRYYTMHPGWVDTPGVQSSMPLFRRILHLVLRTPVQGIDTSVWLAATRPLPKPERIFFDRKSRRAHIFATTREHAATPAALADALNARLAAID